MPNVAPLKLNTDGARRLVASAVDNTVASNHEGPFGAAQIGLFTAWPGYTPDLTLADLTEAGYTGYARQAVTWGSTYIGSDGQPAVMSGLHTFRPSDAVTPNTVLGVFLVDSIGDLMGVGQLPATVALDSADAVLHLINELALQPTTVIGQSIGES